jgi:hypothetical protein
MVYKFGLLVTVVLNSFWFFGYPDFFRYPLWLFWILIFSTALVFRSIDEYHFKAINIFIFIISLIAYNILYGIYSTIFFIALIIILLSFFVIIDKSKIENFYLICYINILLLSALLFYYLTLENGWKSSIYFSIEPSNFSFTALFSGQLLFLSKRKLIRYSGMFFIVTSLCIYPSKTLFIGTLIFFVACYLKQLNSLMLRAYSFICFVVPIIIILFSDIFYYYLTLLSDDGSLYAYLKGWLIATDIFQDSFFGKGFIPADSSYYIPKDNSIVEALNNRDLASLNPFLLASHGIFYFIFFGFFIIKKVSIGYYGPILLSYLAMYFTRWSGFYNSTFILALVFFIVYNNREFLINSSLSNKIKSYEL